MFKRKEIKNSYKYKISKIMKKNKISNKIEEEIKRISILNDFNHVLKINNLHPSELWKNLNINEINLLTEILNEYPTNNKNINKKIVTN